MSKFRTSCGSCYKTIQVGQRIFWEKKQKPTCETCGPGVGEAWLDSKAGYHTKWPDAGEGENKGDSLEVALDGANDSPGEPHNEGMVDEGPDYLRGLVKDAVDAAMAGTVSGSINQAIMGATAAVQTVALRAAEEAAKEAARIASMSNRSVEVSVGNGQPPIKVEGAHYQFERLVKLLGAGVHVYLWGPSGSGKSTAAVQAAKALSREVEVDMLTTDTFRSMIQGFIGANGQRAETSFSRCWMGKKIYVCDEADYAPGHVQALFQGGLANGVVPFAWGNEPRSEGFGFVGTGNTPLAGPTREFTDRKPGSPAFKDRLYFMYWPIDEAIEFRAVGMAAPPAPTRQHEKVEPQRWVKFVTGLRAWAKTNAPTLMITPRASLVGINALALGETPNEVADGLIFRGCDPDLRTKALSAVKWS